MYIIPIIMLLQGYTASFAQSYNTAVGMRLGTDWGITVQQRIAKKATVEAILQSSLQREEVILTGLVEQHLPLISRRLNFYTGAGVHKGWSNTIEGEGQTPQKDPFGVTFIGGLEFTIARINLTYDFKPAVNISGGEKTFYTQSGISMRYVIIKRKGKLAKKRQKRRRQRQRDKAKGKNNNKFNWKIWQKQ